MKVLIVDDSVVFRTQISAALMNQPEIEVIGTAANGRIALQKLEQLSCDLVTLDLEMPEMHGMEVLRQIKARRFPVRVIVFSSQTQRGAEGALEALRCGADDVVAKPAGPHLSIETASESIRSMLVPKIFQFVPRKEQEKKQPVGVFSDLMIQKNLDQFFPKIIVMGSSTGGPPALEKIFNFFSPPMPFPLVLVQHMPPVFTQILAKRLGEISGLVCAEAESGKALQPNHVYVAPGDFHLEIKGSITNPYLSLNQNPPRNSVRPAVDSLFESAAAVYGASCLGVVLTGMGEDGRVGARSIREKRGAILIQDRESSVVFGMPGAIFEAGDYDKMLPLSDIGPFLKKKMN